MMHYALVSDLLTLEEFEERVEAKSAALGGIVDEVTAAMMVVDDLGRSHVPIGDIPKSSAGIVSFFGKIISIEGPREFVRDGESEPGMLATIILGDPTGTTKTTLWDEKAAAVHELSVGSVVEVIGRPRVGRKEVSFIAMRESNVEIVETKKPPTEKVMASPVIAHVLYVSPVREIPTRDGSFAHLQELIVGDESGTARLTTWYPDNFSDVSEGTAVAMSNIMRREDDGVVSYQGLETTVVIAHPDPIPVFTIDVDEVETGQTPVVLGTVAETSEIHTFVNRRNNVSKVRNIKVRGKEGNVIAAALWGTEAEKQILVGDTVEILNAVAKPGRFIDIELSVGSGSIIRVIEEEGVPVQVSGSVVLRNIGLTLETEEDVYLLIGENLPEPGMAVAVSGMLSGSRLTVAEGFLTAPDVSEVLSHL